MANYILLERIELNASAASVTFANIPQSGYTDLKIVVSARTARADNGDYILLSLNSAEATSAKGLWGYGTTAISDTTTNNALIVPGDSATASTFGNLEIYCPNYTSSTNKSISINSSAEDRLATSQGNKITTLLWSSGSASTSGVTSIVLSGRFASFLQYSTFSLYGLAAVGTTPAIAPKASGGNIITTDGTYWYHAFLSSGTFTPLASLSCGALVVAGGGAGASVGGSAETGGGGGAGGFRALLSQSFSATAYAVTVGAGGSVGSSGSNSSVNSISASGGGAGGGGAGGSGGGGLSQNGAQRLGGAGNAGSYSPVEGYAGGNGDSSSSSFAGGGGGAGAVGANGAGGQSGAGGIGSYSAISGGSTTALGVLSGGNYYFAGGGGGGSASGVSSGAGGTGGGGGGNTAGTANTGGGGGGRQSSGGSSPSGGSGIVIIRYAV